MPSPHPIAMCAVSILWRASGVFEMTYFWSILEWFCSFTSNHPHDDALFVSTCLPHTYFLYVGVLAILDNIFKKKYFLKFWPLLLTTWMLFYVGALDAIDDAKIATMLTVTPLFLFPKQTFGFIHWGIKHIDSITYTLSTKAIHFFTLAPSQPRERRCNEDCDRCDSTICTVPRANAPKPMASDDISVNMWKHRNRIQDNKKPWTYYRH